MMKFYFSLLVTVIFSNLLFAQTETVTLTKQQMREDYDMFCRIMAEVNPQLTLRKKITGVDVVDYLQKQRAVIDTLTNPEGLIQILFKGLSLCNDGHAYTIRWEDRLLEVFHNDTLRTTKILSLLKQYSDDKGKSYYSNRKQLMLFLEYYKGDYYSMGELIVSHNNETGTLPSGAKIMDIGGVSIDSLTATYAGTYWDVMRSKPYVSIVGGMYVERKDTIYIKYEYLTDLRELKIIPDKTIQSTSGGAYLLPASYAFKPEKGVVDYFSDEKILYVRLPAMEDEENFYQTEIAKHREKPIEKVIIDIRQNGGGSDFVWRDVLSAIVKDTLDIRAPIGLKNTDRALQAYGVSRDTLGIVKIPLLDNEEFALLKWGLKVIPTSQTLGYTGKIYILQDRRIYSAAGSLSNVAQMYNNIVSVGEATGKLLGFGITPITFTLPHTGFTFQLEPVLDLSNATTLWDYYHDKVEIPVDISVAQRVKYFNYSIKGNIYSKEFLFNHDPVFQKVLEQKSK
jgi:hypothetical protein